MPLSKGQTWPWVSTCQLHDVMLCARQDITETSNPTTSWSVIYMWTLCVTAEPHADGAVWLRCRCGCVAAAWRSCPAPGWLTSSARRSPTTTTLVSTPSAMPCGWPRYGWTTTNHTSTSRGICHWRYGHCTLPEVFTLLGYKITENLLPPGEGEPQIPWVTPPAVEGSPAPSALMRMLQNLQTFGGIPTSHISLFIFISKN